MSGRGEIAVVLHAHMPYVEGYDTWPFGEEWLWEAAVHCYLPLADLLAAGPPLTLSLTPVLLDQLHAEGLSARFRRFIEEVRARTFAADIRWLQERREGAAAEALERCWEDRYLAAASRCREPLVELRRLLLGAGTLTSAATHAVLPLLASQALLRAQLRIGVETFRSRTGRSWDGGFWLPECGYANWLQRALGEEGVEYFCVQWPEGGGGDPVLRRPARLRGGPVAVPIDRQAIDLVWGATGYPSATAHCCTFRRTPHGHCAWAIDGSPYDPARARAVARDQAAAYARELQRRADGGALVVVAFDAELFGLWWHEGLWFLEALVEALSEGPARLVRLGEAAAVREAAVAQRLPRCPCSWGRHGDLSTWSSANGTVRTLAQRARALELEVVGRGPAAGAVALRQLLALQSSDWLYMIATDSAAPYGSARFRGHQRALERALRGEPVEGPRDLAVSAAAAVLGEP